MYEGAHTFSGEPIAGPASPGLGARGVVRHARRYALQILLCGIAAAAAAQAGLGLVSPTYLATLQMLVDPAGVQILDRDIVDRSPRVDSGLSLVESQMQVMRSDSVLRRVVADLDLGADPEFDAVGWGDRVSAWISGSAGPAAPGPAEVALEVLRQKTSVRRADQALVIDVSAETREPAKSARIANAIAAAFLRVEAADRAQTARRLSGSLGGGLPELKGAVAEAEARIVRYRRENGLVDADGAPLNDRQLGALNRRITVASLQTAQARERLDQAQGARADDAAALPEMVQSDELRRLRQEYFELSRGMAEQAARLGARHPAVAESAGREQELRRQLQRERERIVESLRKDYERAVASEAAIRGELASTKSDVAGTDRAAVGLRELNRELDARRSVYEAYLRRSREIGEQAQVDSARIRIISPALPPGLANWPPPRRTVLLQAFGLGLVLGLPLALARGVRRDRRAAARALPG